MSAGIVRHFYANNNPVEKSGIFQRINAYTENIMRFKAVRNEENKMDRAIDLYHRNGACRCDFKFVIRKFLVFLWRTCQAATCTTGNSLSDCVGNPLCVNGNIGIYDLCFRC